MNISSISPNFYNSKSQPKSSNPNFTGLINNKVYNAIESTAIGGCKRLVNNKSVEKLITSTSKYKKFTDNLTSHLIVLGSTLLSGFYVLKTLKNKDLDEDKRKTLAINQGLVYGASTIMAYTFDGWARKKFNKIFDKFEKYNAGEDVAKMAKWKSGFGLARTIIIVDTVYRFIAPVIVTPLANYIGNKLQENKKSAQ